MFNLANKTYNPFEIPRGPLSNYPTYPSAARSSFQTYVNTADLTHSRSLAEASLAAQRAQYRRMAQHPVENVLNKADTKAQSY